MLWLVKSSLNFVKALGNVLGLLFSQVVKVLLNVGQLILDFFVKSVSELLTLDIDESKQIAHLDLFLDTLAPFIQSLKPCPDCV